jgi:hypothetical protein
MYKGVRESTVRPARGRHTTLGRPIDMRSVRVKRRSCHGTSYCTYAGVNGRRTWPTEAGEVSGEGGGRRRRAGSREAYPREEEPLNRPRRSIQHRPNQTRPVAAPGPAPRVPADCQALPTNKRYNPWAAVDPPSPEKNVEVEEEHYRTWRACPYGQPSPLKNMSNCPVQLATVHAAEPLSQGRR